MSQNTSNQEAQALHLIRDWRIYLHARQVLLSQTAVANAFERDPGTQLTEEAEADIAALGQERRRLFESAFQERRVVWQTTLEAEQAQNATMLFLDQGLVEQRVLAECLDLVEGQKHPDGPGYVRYPALAGEPITWHDAFLPELDTIPDEAAYRLGQRHSHRRDYLIRIGAGLLLLPLCALLLWVVFAPETAPARAADQSQPEYALASWPTARLLVEGAETAQEGAIYTLDALPWRDDGQAYLLTGAHLPLQICLPTALFEQARILHLLGDGVSPERIYTLSDDKNAAPDLLVAACGKSDQLRQAYLSDTQSQPAAQLGETRSLQSLKVTLEQLVVRGPAEDSSIPEQSMRVTLLLSAVLSDSTAPDWAAYAPTLRLLDGSLQSAPQLQVNGESVELSYLVQSQQQPGEAELRLSDAAGHSVRWRVALSVPPDRPTLLGSSLHIDALEAADNFLSITITNQGKSDLLLQTSDFILSQEELPFTLQAIHGLETALAPGEGRHIQVMLPEEAIGDLTLDIGPYRYRVARNQ